METSRRGFLRLLGLGAAAAVAAPLVKPKSFFSFFTGEVWAPKPIIIPGNVLTLADWVKRLPPDHHQRFAKIADLLNEPCPVFDDLPWIGDPKLDS